LGVDRATGRPLFGIIAPPPLEEMARCTAVLYPTETPEVNCMIALEAQALGAMVTTDDFALRETLASNRQGGTWGTLLRD
jgi:hypothetical protein